MISAGPLLLPVFLLPLQLFPSHLLQFTEIIVVYVVLFSILLYLGEICSVRGKVFLKAGVAEVGRQVVERRREMRRKFDSPFCQ